MDKPEIIQGGLAVDDRGSVSFVNGFNFEGVKRFYQVENHAVGFIRAWHGHEKEGKYVYVTSGSALVGAAPFNEDDINNKEIVKINGGTQPAEQFVLSAKAPRILWIPPGYANGFKTLEPNTKILFFSTSTLEDSLGDDIRFPHDFWDIWKENYR